MKETTNHVCATLSAAVFAAIAVGCASVQEQPRAAATAAPQQKATAEKAEPRKAKAKAVEVEGVISDVGQRTITFQTERKGKVRQEVVGVDEKTRIEKGGAAVKLKDLEVSDKALINYEPDAYTPALAIKVTGKGTLKKVGGDD
ncbi:MAG TPA: hypothetical protein VNN77_15880 [candidate division Zixibacteria bacterium]|nr:hypothetical protein [candidate division Zixibacteria bacterium]